MNSNGSTFPLVPCVIFLCVHHPGRLNFCYYARSLPCWPNVSLWRSSLPPLLIHIILYIYGRVCVCIYIIYLYVSFSRPIDMYTTVGHRPPLADASLLLVSGFFFLSPSFSFFDSSVVIILEFFFNLFPQSII